MTKRAAPAILAALALLALAPAAWATTTVTYTPATGVLVQGDATGEGVAVRTATGPDRVFVDRQSFLGTIPGATIVAGSGCQQAGVDASCPLTASRIVTANLGDGNDGFDDVSSLTDPTAGLFVDGGGGNDLLRGGPAADSLRGGLGNDQLSAGAAEGAPGANDVTEGGDGSDRLTGDGGGTNTVRGGAGNDTFVAATDNQRSADLFDGGSGIDTADYSGRAQPVTLRASVQSTPTPDDGRAGEADDLDNVEKLIGGSAGDTIQAGNLLFGLPPRDVWTLTGNAGADTLRVTGQIKSSMDGGLGPDTVTGGPAADSIFSREGEKDTLSCGGAIDTLTPDLADTPLPADCENLDQSDRREAPNVAVRTRVARVDEDGSLALRLACPRSVRIGCRGALAARLDRRGTRFGPGERYSLRRGRSAVIEVELPAGQVAGARRRGGRVRVRSVERGIHGRKTTQRSLPARRG